MPSLFMLCGGIIREASNSDLEEIVEIERRCFARNIAYSKRQLKYLLTKANSDCLTMNIAESLKGFILVLYKRGSRVAGIETIDVDPNFQGKGIGTSLLEAAEENMKSNGIEKIILEVSVGNHLAIKFYERAGFRKATILKDYYFYEHHGSRDAYRMVKDLTT